MNRKRPITPLLAALLLLVLCAVFMFLLHLTPLANDVASPALAEQSAPPPTVTSHAGAANETSATNPALPIAASSIFDAAITPSEAETDAAWILAALQKKTERADQDIDHFCEVNDALKKSPLFTEQQGTHDAAPFMASKVDWEAPLGGTPRIGSLHLPEPLRLKVREPDWRTTLTPLDVQGLDFTWLASLRDFDVWTLQGDGALGFTLYPATVTPLPNDLLLEWHAKLRLVQAALWVELSPK